MIKIPTVFVRDWDGDRNRVLDQVTPGCEWVLAGEGRPTRKWDGTACLWRGQQLWKRYDAKVGRVPPFKFFPAQPAPDPETGHWPGWVPLDATDRWHHEALRNTLWQRWQQQGLVEEATYELVGPKINRNPDQLERHVLIPHGEEEVPSVIGLFTYTQLRDALSILLIEGIVWWHPDGRKAKLKRRDLGLPWPPLAGAR